MTGLPSDILHLIVVINIMGFFPTPRIAYRILNGGPVSQVPRVFKYDRHRHRHRQLLNVPSCFILQRSYGNRGAITLYCQYTVHCSLHTVYSVHCTVYCILYTVHYTQCIVNSVQCTVYCTLFSTHSV